jgi:hypothetical protein
VQSVWKALGPRTNMPLSPFEYNDASQPSAISCNDEHGEWCVKVGTGHNSRHLLGAASAHSCPPSLAAQAAPYKQDKK